MTDARRRQLVDQEGAFPPPLPQQSGGIHPSARRVARPVRPLLAIYWLILIGGLVLFTATHSDSAIIAALWTGAVGGTLLGQYLAFHNYRLWISVLCIAAVLIYCSPLVSLGEAATPLWESFIPAALCGFWTLGDRSALAAVWFPTVIWMLTILDRSDRVALGGPGAVLLGTIAALFVCFLYVRETRRIALWSSVAAEPIAPATPAELLREPPGRQLARAAWWLSVGALTVAITVWLVPPLWQSETLGGPSTRLAAAAAPAGRPCCPAHDDADTHSTRIKEYLDLGLGHDPDVTEPLHGFDCRRCDAAVAIASGSGDTAAVATGTTAVPGSGGGTVVDVDGQPTTTWSRSHGRPGVIVRDPYVPPPGTPSDPSQVDASPAAPDSAGSPGPTVVPPAPQPPRPAAPAPRPAPTVEPPSPRPVAATPPADLPPAAAAESPTARSRGLADLVGPSLIHWLAFAAVAAVVSQLLRLGLRPLRRLVTLRHLRRPFWDETVAQRVSNAWQLALVGLRDAGWRSGPSEPPRDLARRTHVDGVERCATILERARHGVGLDAGDLAEMQTSADAAYRAARTGLGPLPRVLAWLRWPLT
ncbi:MAG TPA: hypothetical protein VHW23_42065 [Kofleriaceae bacterium]|nr:hypothetical protein [Kofleriaceae bacterium]